VNVPEEGGRGTKSVLSEMGKEHLSRRQTRREGISPPSRRRSTWSNGIGSPVKSGQNLHSQKKKWKNLREHAIAGAGGARLGKNTRDSFRTRKVSLKNEDQEPAEKKGGGAYRQEGNQRNSPEIETSWRGAALH